MKTLVLTASLLFASLTSLAGDSFWPLYSDNEKGVDIIWPLAHFGKKDGWHVFPVINREGVFCIFPELWFTERGFGVLPIFAAYDFSQGAVAPIIWWGDNEWGSYHSVFPLYWYSEEEGSGRLTTWWLCGLAGYTERGGHPYSYWVMPFYYWNRDGEGLFSSGDDSSGSLSDWRFTLFGTYAGDTSGSWCWPFYEYRHRVRGGVTSTRWGNPLLFTRETTISEDTTKYETRFLWRFYHRIEEDEAVSIEAFPCFFHESKPYGAFKTSLLWRLYRHEYDPDTEKREIDFLFLPIWR